MKKNANLILLAVGACFIASIGEFVSIFALGQFYPGYSQLKDTMSALGASVSPVSNIISTWWVIMGFLMIFFGLMFKRAFQENGRYVSLASWLIVLYGFGEGIGSGAFKANFVAGEFTSSAIVHDFLGGIGVVAILLLPLVMLKVISRAKMPRFHRMSKIMFVTGIVTILLFLFRFSTSDHSFLAEYKGLWQRLYMLNTYIYLATVAVIMAQQRLGKSTLW